MDAEYSSSSVDDVSIRARELLERADHFVQAAIAAEDSPKPEDLGEINGEVGPSSSAANEVDASVPVAQDSDVAVELIGEMRRMLALREAQIQQVSHQSETLAIAQAEAIVHSAEIIDELERTKQKLSAATSAAETAARDMQQLAETVFARTSDGVLIFRGESCQACNDNAARLLGEERKQLLGNWPSTFDQSLEEDGESASELLRRSCREVSEERPVVLELILPHEKRAYWAEITISALVIKDSRQALVVVRDIDARKRFESEVHRHRDFLDNIINAVADQLSVYSLDRRLVLANQAYCNSWGLSREEIAERRINDKHLLECNDEHQELEDRLRELGGSETFEREIECENGSRSIMSVSRSLFADKRGTKYIVATSRDITEDRRRENRLRLLASVFNGASEGVAILSMDGRIREANPAFLRMTRNSNRFRMGGDIRSVLRFESIDIGEVLREVALGEAWSGKAYVYANLARDRHFWISLSPSAEKNAADPRIIALVSDITELQSAQEKLRSQALQDNLTRLPNRRSFREHLQTLVDQPLSQLEGITVCFIDLDDFKHVNDSCGHAAGDQLLKLVSRRFKKLLGSDVFVARFGGDEFALVLTGENQRPAQLNHCLKRMLTAFRRPFQLGETEAIVGLSIGVTRYPEQADSVETLMCNADVAMYEAKSAGKNRICFYSPKLSERVSFRHQIHTKLRRALHGGELSLFYQPKVNALTRNHVGCEALVRWATADGGFISPGEFIPIAEQTGLIQPLGEYVFRAAAQQAVAWDAMKQGYKLAVNVSPNQMRHPGFIEQMQATLRETGASAECFELEITESAMMDDVENSIKTIDRLAALGFRVAIDDFGTGYSSLSYLKHFNIHTLKIDLSFVRDVTHDQQSEAVVRSIVSLGAGLGLDIVAEGVETHEQAAMLSQMGCTTLQGYHIGRPMPVDQYAEWLVKPD